MKAREYILWLSLICAAAGALQAQDEARGYRLRARYVEVQSAGDWQVWEAPLGVRAIDRDGTVRPRFARGEVNAVANAGEFMRVAGKDTIYGGISAAGTRPEEAARIIDGDPRTFWEPDPDSALRNWFAIIDLGRTVIARRIVVRFVDEDLGDPFLKFRVMISDGREVFGRNRSLQFFRIAQVDRRNKDQREFVFEVEPLRAVPEGVEGEAAQFVRIDALDTDGARGEEVDAEAYERLAPADRGAVDYFRRTVKGREILVLPGTYAALPRAEKGPVRRYRRERPRLAEVEVQTLGDNIVALTQRELFVAQDFFSSILLRQLTDGNYNSSFDLKVYDSLNDRNQVEIDLGAKYWLNRIRLLSAQRPLSAYQVRISDGSLDPQGAKVWQSFDERLNPDSFLQLEETFPLQEVRFIQLRRLQLIGAEGEGASLSEIQAYGEGYVSDVQMNSPLIRLRGLRIFSTLEWEGDEPPNTRIEVRTRSGDDLQRDTLYFDSFGRQISRQRWENIRNVNLRGPVEIEESPGPLWSNWSEVYEAPGTAFKSPNPRRMVQVQVRLRSEEPLRAAALRRLRLNFSAPLVEEAVAEIWPVRGVEPGLDQEFTLYLRPRFARENPGFDRLRLHSTAAAPMELLSVRVGQDRDFRLGRAEELWPQQVQAQTDPQGGLALRFAAPVSDDERVYAITFRTRVFLNSTTFFLELANSRRPDLVQRASPGDASALAAGQGLVVVTDLRRTPLLGALEVSPRVFTPNGDGINDEMRLEFSVFRLEGERTLGVEVFTLSGRRVRDLSRRAGQISGRHRFLWDGRDQAGALVPPGVYLVRVSLETDAGAGGTTRVQAVHLVY